MSMTKRYLESLPVEEQEAILGRHDEWTESAENEPEANPGCGDIVSTGLHPYCMDCGRDMDNHGPWRTHGRN